METDHIYIALYSTVEENMLIKALNSLIKLREKIESKIRVVRACLHFPFRSVWN